MAPGYTGCHAQARLKKLLAGKGIYGQCLFSFIAQARNFFFNFIEKNVTRRKNLQDNEKRLNIYKHHLLKDKLKND